jgi:hypothetical protein
LVGVGEIGDEEGVDAARDVAHETTPDLLRALAFGGAPGDVVAGWGVMDHAIVGGQPERAVGLSIAAAVEAVAAGLAA